MTDGTWTTKAACRGVDDAVIFPKQRRDAYAPARKVCAPCTVKTECLLDALDAEGARPSSYRHGIRAGLTPVQRFHLAKRRAAAARAATAGEQP